MALALCITQINKQGRELIDHGTASFPIACYHDDLLKEDVPWHWHEELEFVLVTEGTSAVVIGSEKRIVKQGHGFFVNTGVLHSALSIDHTNCRFHSLVFHPRLVGGSIESVFWQNYIYPLTENISLKDIFFDCSEPWHEQALCEIETAWQSCVNEPLGYEFMVRHALSQVILLISKHFPTILSPPTEKTMRDGKRIKTMLKFIHGHFDEELNTLKIAQSAMLSESECLRCFHYTIGTPPIQYLKQYRIARAADLLLSTSTKIVEIGAKCGMHDPSYFTKIFREEKGCTPTEYRKKN